MKKSTILIVLSVILFNIQFTSGQQKIKRDKQQTKFHYLQTNFHIGYFDQRENKYFDLSNVGPSNSITYQFLSKNQRRLQRGYTKLFALTSFKAKFSLQFKGGLNQDNFKDDIFSLKPQNVGLSFSTKWDRTSFFVGYGSIKFGNNPKIDPVSSFTANITSKDLGFGQDFGFFMNTPISSGLDSQIGLSVGGTVSKSLLTYNSNTGEFNNIELDYRNTWLITGRIGVPSFKPFEYGLQAMLGKLNNRGDISRRINRLGLDAVYKVGEIWKFGAMAVIGNTSYIDEVQQNENNYNFQGNIEYYLNGQFIFNVSNGLFITDYDKDSLETKLKGQLINSISYVVSPHTRFRLNNFFNYSNKDVNDWGVMFQIVTGFGSR